MSRDIPDWDQRVAAAWATFDDYAPADFLALMQNLVAERTAQDPRALFELASTHDSLGNEEQAAPLYRSALMLGLATPLRRQAIIQLASTLRNLGQAEDSVALLQAELSGPSDELDDALRAFLALALFDLGHQAEALSQSLSALSRHLPRYQRSLRNYAAALLDPPDLERRE